MISNKKLMSVAAAVALSTVAVYADYLPLTSTTQEDKWVMFGVTGFHANGATDGSSATGAVDAGMFSISDTDIKNVAKDTGADELYGDEGVGTITDAISDGTNVFASVKRIDGVASPVEVRVDVVGDANIVYDTTDPVRTIYVKKEAGDTSSLFAFTYKSILEGQKLEFTTTSAGANDDAYRVTINSENTYNNPAIAEFIPAVDGSGATDGDSGAYLTAIADAVDYDFTAGPQGINPENSAKYLVADHKNIAAAGQSLRMYSYNPASSWLLYDSRNTLQQFDKLEKGKGYWGKMDQAGTAKPAGLVLGTPSITAQNYIDSGIAEGWNLLAFNADQPDLRVATTGLIITSAAATIVIFDSSGNQSTGNIVLAGAVSEVNSIQINNAIKTAKINGTLPRTFNLIAIPTSAANIALISDERFTLQSSAAAIVNGATTLAGQTPLDATTLVDSLAAGNNIISKYGEYALMIQPENAAYALMDIKCKNLSSQTALPTVAAITPTTCIQAAYNMDTNYDGAIATTDPILMASTAPFEVRDHTFTRIFDYKKSEGDTKLTFVNADSDVATSVTIPGGKYEKFTVDFAALTAGQTYIIAGITITEDDVDGLANGATALEAATSFANLAVGSAANTGAGTAANTVAGTLAEYNSGPVVDGSKVTFTSTTLANATDGAETGTGTVTSLTIANQGVAPTANAAAAVTLLAAAAGLTDNDEVLDVSEQILFRMTGADKNEFQVLETDVGDALTPSTISNVLAQGAISDVWSPNSLVKSALVNTSLETLTDTVAGTDETVTSFTIDVITTLGTITLDPYTVDSANWGDSTTMYANLAAHINAELIAKNIDSTVAIVSTNGGQDFDGTITFTGSDVIDSDTLLVGATATTVAAAVTTLGTPTIGDGDITTDLKYNFKLSPNYVLDGPLYDMKAAGFKAKAMVSGTTNLATDTVSWDSIDLTRKPSEWLDSQDYNLFTVDNAAGYWTYLEAATDNPLTFDTAQFNANYTQHFDQDDKTYNQVAGAININVYGIDYDFDGKESARVIAIVGGSEVELSRQAGDSYAGQISSYELKELTSGKEHDIQVVVADGIGNRIPATSTGVVVDFKKPATPTVAFTGGTMAITNDAADGVTQYFIFNGNIPAVSTATAALAKVTAADAAGYSLCSALSRDNSYNLKVIALDGNTLATSNVSDAFSLPSYSPVFKDSAIITDSMTTNDTVANIASVYYNNSCADTPITFETDKFIATSYTNNKTIKVAYAPITAGTGTALSIFVDGGTKTGTVALLTYQPNYAGKVVFVELDGQLFSYTLPTEAAIPVINSDTSPIDLNTGGTYLAGQNLDQ